MGFKDDLEAFAYNAESKSQAEVEYLARLNKARPEVARHIETLLEEAVDFLRSRVPELFIFQYNDAALDKRFKSIDYRPRGYGWSLGGLILMDDATLRSRIYGPYRYDRQSSSSGNKKGRRLFDVAQLKVGQEFAAIAPGSTPISQAPEILVPLPSNIEHGVIVQESSPTNYGRVKAGVLSSWAFGIFPDLSPAFLSKDSDSVDTYDAYKLEVWLKFEIKRLLQKGSNV
jgi:hypothetical protein